MTDDVGNAPIPKVTIGWAAAGRTKVASRSAPAASSVFIRIDLREGAPNTAFGTGLRSARPRNPLRAEPGEPVEELRKAPRTDPDVERGRAGRAPAIDRTEESIRGRLGRRGERCHHLEPSGPSGASPHLAGVPHPGGELARPDVPRNPSVREPGGAPHR